jgi:hypothetical protein
MGWRPHPDTLPRPLDEIARVVGVDLALKVAEGHGGRRLHVRHEPQADHWLARIIGLKAARLVCQRLGGEVYKIPVATAIRNKMRATELREAGRSWNEIGAALNISQSQAQHLCAGIEKGAAAAEEPTAGDDHCPACGRRLRRRVEPAEDGRQMVLPWGNVS